VLVLGGDHVYTMDYSEMLLHHVQTGADFTVGSIECQLPRRVDSASCRSTRICGSPASPKNRRTPTAFPANPASRWCRWDLYFLQGLPLQDADRRRDDEASSHDFGKDIIPNSIGTARAIAFPFRNKDGLPDYWRDVGTLYSYWQTNMELCSVEPELNLYNRDWPIWTYQPQYPPAKFILDDENRRGEAIDSLIAGGCILSGARVKRSVLFFATTVENYSLIKDSVILPRSVSAAIAASPAPSSTRAA